MVGELGGCGSPPDFFIGGLVDNFTRLHHAYGEDHAQAVWRFSQDAAAWWAKQLSPRPCAPLAKLRLHATEHQQTEGREAQRLLASLGLGSVIESPADGQRFGLHPPEQLIHCEEGQGFVLAAAPSLSQSSTPPALEGPVMELNATAAGFTASTAAGESIAATMVVMASEAALLRLRPFYREVLIPYSDQWQSYAFPAKDLPSAVFYADHGYVYGYHHPSEGRLLLGGGRFLAKGARIGDASAGIDENISAYLHKRAEDLLGESLPLPAARGGFWDSRSCDELPVIGPDFREPQLLLAGGFMGGGEAIAHYSGALLAQLIATGAADQLPRQLWPSRLRSL